MKSKKAYIKSDGKIGEKEQSAVEYVDKNYLENKEKQKREIDKILLTIKSRMTDAK